MELPDFIEQDALHFLDEAMQQQKSRKETDQQASNRQAAAGGAGGGDEMELYTLDRDYEKELRQALEDDSISHAKRIFDDLKNVFNRIPEKNYEKKQIYRILESMYNSIKNYLEAKEKEKTLAEEIRDPKLAQAFSGGPGGMVAKIEESPFTPRSVAVQSGQNTSDGQNLQNLQNVQGGQGGQPILADEWYGIMRDIKDVKSMLSIQPSINSSINWTGAGAAATQAGMRVGAGAGAGGASYSQQRQEHATSSFITAVNAETVSEKKEQGRTIFDSSAYPAPYPQQYPQQFKGSDFPGQAGGQESQVVSDLQGQMHLLEEELQQLRKSRASSGTPLPRIGVNAYSYSPGSAASSSAAPMPTSMPMSFDISGSMQRILANVDAVIDKKIMSAESERQQRMKLHKLQMKLEEERELQKRLEEEHHRILILQTHITQTLMRIQGLLGAGAYSKAVSSLIALRKGLISAPWQVKKEFMNTIDELFTKLTSLEAISRGKGRYRREASTEEALYKLALYHMSQKDYTKAKKFFTQLLSHNPHHVPAMIRLSQVKSEELKTGEDSAVDSEHASSFISIPTSAPDTDETASAGAAGIVAPVEMAIDMKMKTEMKNGLGEMRSGSGGIPAKKESDFAWDSPQPS